MSQSLKEKIISRMALLDIQPKRSLGQNFLVSNSVVSRIVRAAEPDQFEKVFEIGPGLGALTDDLLKQNSNLELVELDKKFAQFWREKDITVHEVDALRHSWEKANSQLLVSNLPYQISSRLVVELSLLSPIFDRMVLMFQKEVAQRITAKESTVHYGLLTVVAQVFWNVRLLLEAGAVDFMPKPNVASRVLVFDLKKSPPQFDNPKAFLVFLKTAFANRRKKLLPKLTGYQPKEELIRVFEELGLVLDIRAEKLSPDQFISLYTHLKKE